MGYRIDKRGYIEKIVVKLDCLQVPHLLAVRPSNRRGWMAGYSYSSHLLVTLIYQSA